jgi:sugar-specific transcriptional regulator TrmB
MDLKLLGLTDYEAKAYEALVKLGKATAAQISKESGVSYGKIYTVLDSLEAKGLVKIVPEMTKKFVATDPESLIQLVKKREHELGTLKTEITELRKVYEFKEKDVVQMVQGKRNFYKIIRAMKEPKKFKYTIKYLSEFQPEWARQDKQALKRGVSVKSLARYDDETKTAVQKWLGVHSNIRKFDNKGVAIDIRDSEIVITLIKSNVILSIKDETLVDVFKRMFTETYKAAQEVK